MSCKFAGEPALTAIGLGCARIGSFNNPQSVRESRALVAHAVASGVCVIDTSNIYGQGDSETEIGKALAGIRNQAFLVTKGGRGFSGKMRLLRPFKPFLRPLLAARRGSGGGGGQQNAVTAHREAQLRQDWMPYALEESLDQSLRRLRTDRVDAFLLHSPPADVAGDPRIGDVLGRMHDAGKARYVGISCDDLQTLQAALTLPSLSIVQLPWDVVKAAQSSPVGLLLAARGIIVLAREVIRMQPGLAPHEAVRSAIANPLVTTSLVGTTSKAHLDAIVAAI